jgi:cytoskeleton protein RodZ
MSETNDWRDELLQPAADAAAAPPADAPPPAAFGARLKWERERAGLSVGDVATRLRLHVNQVRALEDENLKALPEAAYVRGFLRSYARALDLDPTPLLADYGARVAPPEASVVDGMTQTRDYSPVRAAAREQTSRRVVITGSLVLLAALGAIGWYVTHNKPAEVAVPAAPPPAVPAAPAPAPAPVAAAPAATPSPTPVEPSPALTEPVAATPLLKLRFNGPSWAEVKDAEGKVLHSQQNVAGTEFVIEGTPPFYVVIGDAANAVVEVRGEPYDMAAVARQNVARFTVN